MRVPLVDDDAGADIEANMLEQERGSPAPVKKRILEVSDEEAIREINAVICGGFGFKVIQASHGDQALKQYRERGPYACVLTDLHWHDRIPEPPLDVKTIRDGIQLASAIRKLDPKQKIVIHTASRMLLEQLPKELRDVSILHKPYSREELESVLEKL
jgi:CheY-like chemotaxis protein